MKSLQTVLNILNKRRNDAINEAQANVDKANSNSEYAKLQIQLNTINRQIAQNNTQELSLQRLAIISQTEKLLKSMGLSFRHLKPKYQCNKCSDIGYYNGNKCECLNKLISEITLNVVKIDPNCLFTNAINDNEINAKIYNKCNKLAASDSFNILICGKVGTGKSYLVQCIANEKISQGCDVVYTSAFNFNSDMLAVHKSSSEEILPQYLMCDLLVIDDLGTEPIYKNVTLEYLFNVISERQRNKLCTIITTNLNLEGINERYSERIFSRLTDKRNCLVYELIGKDRRHG